MTKYFFQLLLFLPEIDGSVAETERVFGSLGTRVDYVPDSGVEFDARSRPPGARYRRLEADSPPPASICDSARDFRGTGKPDYEEGSFDAADVP